VSVKGSRRTKLEFYEDRLDAHAECWTSIQSSALPTPFPTVPCLL
jgi:hypothetical protein